MFKPEYQQVRCFLKHSYAVRTTSSACARNTPLSSCMLSVGVQQARAGTSQPADLGIGSFAARGGHMYIWRSTLLLSSKLRACRNSVLTRSAMSNIECFRQQHVPNNAQTEQITIWRWGLCGRTHNRRPCSPRHRLQHLKPS